MNRLTVSEPVEGFALLLRKKFAVSSKIRYPLAVALIVLPAIALGVIGSIAIDSLEDEPTIREKSAESVVSQTRATVRGVIQQAVPDLALSPDGEVPDDSHGREGASFVTPDGLLARQRSGILVSEGRVILAAVNFLGGARQKSIFIDEGDEEILSDLAIATMVEQVRTGTSKRELMPLAVPGLDPGEVPSFFYTSLESKPTPFALRRWTAWLISSVNLNQIIDKELSSAQTGEPLRFQLMPPAGLGRDAGERRFEFDGRLYPGASVRVRVDESRLPFGGEGWRSRFYIVFLAVIVPLLGGLLWYIEVVVRREIEDAKNKVDFVANVSHELKTPLTSIRMFIEMLTLGRSQSKKEVQEILQIILRESERLGRLIDRLLDFNRLDRKTKIFNMAPISLATVLRETVKLYRVEEPSAQERRIKLAIEPGLPNVDGDRDALREVILNLLANADKYSPNDKPIDVHLSQEGRWMILDVIDHGQGIPLKYHARIFEKFYRVNDELSRKTEGTGLGLSISQEIAKAHKGEIDIDSAPGQGSCFTLFLPVLGYEGAEGDESEPPRR